MNHPFVRRLALVGPLILSACGGGSSPNASNKPNVIPPQAVAKTVTVVQNKYGAWLWYADQLGKTHTQIADDMASIGVKRIIIKIGDGRRNCDRYTDVCNSAVPAIYKSRGIEPFTFSYNYTNDASTGVNDAQYHALQAVALTQSIQYGYMGHIIDIETEFDGVSGQLEDMLKAFRGAYTTAQTPGGLTESFAIGATTWGNPKDHSMRVDLIDKYVDFHMPQTYVEQWASNTRLGYCFSDTRLCIDAVNKEYRSLGVTKPIWHILAIEKNTISPTQLAAFFEASGPNTSIWRIPDGGANGVPLSALDKWRTLDWTRLSFIPTQDSEALNFAVSTPLYRK